MHGCGNDYVYVDGSKETIADPARVAREVSDRHFGIGSDGLILILPSEAADFRMRMFNPDGSEAHCGNGLRCVAKYVYDHRLTDKRQFRIETLAGVLPVELVIEGRRATGVRVNMGRPKLERAEIPMKGKPGRVIDEPLEAADREFRVTSLSMGNPHCVIYVDDVDAFPVKEAGREIENHPAFLERTNVEFVTVVSRGEVRQRTWERGTGETLACGTGASAVCVAGVLTGRTDEELHVRLRGGMLDIAWPGRKDVILTGGAVTVFEGVYEPQ
ncbi:MAG: diaminopimelate epimerase [Planctomycetota bacterium]